MTIRLASFAAALAAVATPASANPDPRFDAAEQSLRTMLFTNPAQALAGARRTKSLIANGRALSSHDLRLARLEQIEGEALRRLDRGQQAQVLLTRALARTSGQAAGKAVRGDVLLSLGTIYADQARVAEALSMSQQAYKVFASIGQQRGTIKSLIYLADIYDTAKDYRAAAKYLKQAQEVGSTDPDLLIAVYNNLGGALKELGRYEEAGKAYRVALMLARRKDAHLPEASILGGLARNKLLSGDPQGAEKYIEAGLKLTRSGDAQVLRPVLLGVQAQVHVRLHRPHAALRVLSTIFQGDDFGSTSLKDREAHETAWQAYRAAGQPTQALKHLEALKRLDDEATKLATSTSTALMAARFDFANQDLRIATLKAEELRRRVTAEREQARTERLIFGGAAAATLILILLLGVGLFTIRRSRNAVRAANLTLEGTNAELGRALAARTEFLATTSHEIRTPLNGILGMTQVMLADPTLAAPVRERVGVVHAAGKTMRALVDDILDVAKIESGRLTLEAAPFDLDAVTREAASLWEGPIRAKGVGFCYQSDAAGRLVLGDAARTRQVVFNLLSNAAKFTEAGDVTLTVHWDDGHARVVVRDTGVGVSADKLEDIFESFRQADAGTTRRFGGTGLGLSICRRLARAMNGDVAVLSCAGQGSSFTFSVPLPLVAPVHEVAEEGPRPLLVIDRNPITRAMLRSLLDGAGLPVVCASAAEEALAMVRRSPVTGVLMDAAGLGAPDDVAAAADDLAAASDGSVTLLWPADAPAPCVSAAVSVVRKPVSGPELVRLVASGGADGNPTLVSRAA